MRSRIYECHVAHARFLPRQHRFAYRIFMLALDLDELPALHQRLHLFSVGSPNLYAFREEDFLPTTEPVHNPANHADSPAAPVSSALTLKQRVLTYVAAQGIDTGTDARVELVTLPRIFGYLFNPVSFYFVYRASGECIASIAEVTNTFREMKPYLLGPATRVAEPAGAPAAFRLRTPKAFYVSPFSDVDVALDFALRPPTQRLAIQIDDYADGARTLTSTLAGPARALNDRTLAAFTFKYPFLTLRVIALIHWHALKLYVKRVPWFAKAARASAQTGLYRPHGSLKPLASSDS